MEDLKDKLSRLQGMEPDEIPEDLGFYSGQREYSRELAVEEAGNESLMAKGIVKELPFLSKDDYVSALKQISRLYVRGASIPWEEIYRGKKFRKVSIPGYPFT